MALSPEEQDELRRLQAQDAEEKQAEKGNEALSQVFTQARKPRPFSLYRTTVGGLRDAVQNTVEFADEAGDALYRTLPVGPVLVYGKAADNGILGLKWGNEAQQALASTKIAPDLPHLQGEDQAGTVERISRGLVSFVVPFSRFSKAAGITRGASWLGRSGRAMIAGGITDAVTQDPGQTNLATALKEGFGLHNSVLDALATETDDHSLKARFQAAAVNAPVGIAADALMELGFRTVRAYRAWRGTAEEADAAVKAVQADMGLPRSARGFAEDAEQASGGTAKQSPPGGGSAKRGFDPEKDVRMDAPPENFEDVVGFLKKKAGAGELDPELFQRLARNLLDGNPENALKKLNIDPVKLDFSAFDDPALLGRLQDGLAEVYESIAGGLGRTGTRVTEEMTAKAARALATTPDALKDLYGATANLDARLYAARLFAGAHSHKLLDSAQAAIEALKKGEGGAEWAGFMENFYRHAYYLGALRGAGSEVGRALNSLKFTVQVGKAQAEKQLGEVVKQEASKQAAGADKFVEGASRLLADMTDTSDRLLFLTKVMDKGGDMGDLSRFTRTMAGSTLQRLSGALRETVGNLWTATTAVKNAAAGVTFLGLRSAAKWLVAVERAALSPLGAAYAQRARTSAMEAWAYTDGIMSAWRQAWANTAAMLEKESMAEAALNLDSLGLKGLAAKAASLHAEGAAAIRGNFARAEIVNDRAISMTAQDRARLNELIAKTGMHDVMQRGLRFVVRAMAVPVNAAGSLTRIGTTTFIRLPDEFIGTMAAKAGGQAYAARTAGLEAAELHLSGKDLVDYMKARVVQLTETVDGFADDPVAAGAREAALAHGDHEAREILFQDQPELQVNRLMSRAAQYPLLNLFIPIVRTPLRILERTAIDHTPLGLLKDRVRRAIMAGGQDGEEAVARIALGMTALYGGFMFADDRGVLGSDSGFKGSGRENSRPPYSLKIGDDVVDYSGLDPLATLIGMGADVSAYLRAHEDDAEAPGKAALMVEGAFWSFFPNLLNKTWLTSIRNLADLSGATSDQEASTRLRKYVAQFTGRFVPGAGLQRSVVKGGGEQFDVSTDTMWDAIRDGIVQNTLGAPTLPVKRDPILGEPIELLPLDRLLGYKAGPQSDDPLRQELERLSFDLPQPSRTIRRVAGDNAVKLDGEQFQRWLQLRGNVTQNPRTGATLEQTLRNVINLPQYQRLNRTARVDVIRRAMEGYGMLATEHLAHEDKGFAYKLLRANTWNRMELQGATNQQKDAETQRLARQLGLQPQQ
jgi:hypothetical protein